LTSEDVEEILVEFWCFVLEISRTKGRFFIKASSGYGASIKTLLIWGITLFILPNSDSSLKTSSSMYLTFMERVCEKEKEARKRLIKRDIASKIRIKAYFVNNALRKLITSQAYMETQKLQKVLHHPVGYP